MLISMNIYKYPKIIILTLFAIPMLFSAVPALAFSFSVSVSPSSGIVDRGSYINLIIPAATVDASNPEDVEFSVSGLPNYTQATYSSGVCSPNCSTLVNIATKINRNPVPAGKYSLIDRGNAVTTQSIATTTSYTLTVSDPSIGAIAEKSWLQTDSSASQTGFNFTGNGSPAVSASSTQASVRGTGPGAGVGLTHAIINPVQVGLYADNTFQDVFVSGQYAYAAQGSSADFKVINISNPQSPILVATRGALDLASDIQVVGSYIYTTSQSDVRGLQIFNTSSPTIRVGILVIPTKAYGLAVSGNYAYVTSYGIGANGKLTVVDVSNPASPFEVGSATLPTNATGKPYVQGNYLYVSDSSTGLLIFDVSNPNTPTQVGIYNTPDVAYDVFVDGDYAYVADFASGLQIINISNPANPTFAGNYNTPNSARSVYVSEGYAYVGDATSLQIIDVTNPALPVFKKSFVTTNDFDVFVDGDYAYVADNNLGD